MGKIQDRNFWYSLARPFVDMHVFRSFKAYDIVGKENIPKSGACVFGSNHCNTLMDALVLLATSFKRKVFIARADIFKNPKIAKILRWLRILPIFRMRDGLGAVRDNNGDTMDQAIDVIYDEVPLYLFPEATHRTKHSLRQLSKGIFHIALDANKKFGHEKPVYIVPVGLEYGDYFRFRSTILISYGKPINVTEFVKEHEGESEAVIINMLKKEMTDKMAELISYIPDNEEDYDAIWEIAKIKSGQKPKTLKKNLESNQKVIAEMLEMKANEPEKAKELFEKVKEFTKHRKEKGVSVYSVKEKLNVWTTFKHTLMVLLGLPYYILAAVATCPIWIVASIILNGLKDKAFRNTVNISVELVLHPLLMIVGIFLLFSYTDVMIAIFGSILLWLSYIFWFDFSDYIRIWASDVRWIFNGKLRKEFKALKLME